MIKRFKLSKWFLLSFTVFSCIGALAQEPLGKTEPRIQAPASSDAICPILVGQALPFLILRNVDNTLFNLNEAIAKKPTVLIFFRGGWCPYCNRHLAELQSIEPNLIQLGYQIIAVSPDRPEILNTPIEKNGLTYQLLSDSDMKAAEALGIAFQLDQATVEKYKSSYGIDIEADSGHNHHLLPVPSVFVVGTDGLVHFAYVNPNYKVRLDSGLLLKVAEVVKSNK